MVDYDNRSWTGQLGRLHGSVLPNLWPRILTAFVIGTGAVLLGIKVPGLVHTILGAALGLLLVFRTNASYDRYWEGRRLLGSMVNRARDLARQARSYVDGGTDPAFGRHIALVYALTRQHLRKERDLGALGELVTADERVLLEPIATRPNLAMAWLSTHLAARARDGKLTEPRLQAMDANILAFADALGGCERILKTPIPFAYAQHIKAFLVLFCFTAPLALADTMGWYTPFAAAILAYALFGIDEIGVEIEDPFGTDPNDLPLDRIGETLTRDVRELLPW